MNLKIHKILFLLFLLFSFQNNHAQVINSGALTETNHLIVTEAAALLRTDSHITIDSIQTFNEQGKFEKGKKQSTVYIYFDPYYYWFRLIVSNPDSVAKDLALIMPPFGMKDGKLYQKEKMVWKLISRTGYMHAFQTRDYQYAHFAFPFTISPRSIDTLYLDVDASRAYKSYAFALIDQKALKIFESKFYFAFGIILGLLLLFCLLNVYLNFIYEDKIHLWYALYIFLLMLVVMKHDQLDHQFFHWDSASYYRLLSTVGLSALAIGILVHVVQNFLSRSNRRNALNKVLAFTKYIVLLSGITQLIAFNSPPDYKLQNLIWLCAIWSIRIGILLIILNCIYSIWKGYRPALFILGGLIVFLIGSFERILLVGSSSYLFPPTLFHIGMVLEVLIISFGLIYTYRIERKKKHAYLEEKKKLQNNFDEELLRSKIAIQEQTMKNTFQDINNNIGKAIVSVKENIQQVRSGSVTDTEVFLNNSKTLLTNTISDLRNLCKTLDTDYVMDMGLRKSIEHELDQRNRSGKCTLSLKIKGQEYRLESQKELILFRIYQQVVNKIIQDTNTLIIVRLQFETTRLEIQFNGQAKQGGKSTELEENTIRPDIAELQNLAAMIGASFVIGSTLDEDEYTINLPVSELEQEAEILIQKK